LKAIVYLVWIAALALAGVMFGRSAVGATLSGKLLGAALAVSAILIWLSVVRRRERQKLEEMRDSALW
jgi:membrane protein DedA with SNARE-associated domain